jgi:hypothetical protein
MADTLSCITTVRLTNCRKISTHNILIFDNSCWTKEAGVVGGDGLLACRSGVERGLLLDDLAHRRRRLRNDPVEVGHGDAANEC